MFLGFILTLPTIPLLIRGEYALIPTISAFFLGSLIPILRKEEALLYNLSRMNIQEPFFALPVLLYSIL